MKKSYHNYRGYVFTIRFQSKPPAHLVRFVDFPGIITHGESLSEAFANACEALDLHLESLHQLGRPIPKPKRRLVVVG